MIVMAWLMNRHAGKQLAYGKISPTMQTNQ